MTGTALPASGVPAAEVQITEPLVRALLREQCPQWATLPLQKFAEGWDNVMFRLGNDYLIRLPRRAVAAPLITHEQTWLPQLSDLLPIPIPAPVHKGSPSRDYPWHWSVLPHLPGATAYEHTPAGDQALALADFFKALHVPAPPAAPFNEYRGVPLSTREVKLQERMTRLRTRTSLITPMIEKLWRDALAAPLATQRVWLHGDLHALNVLVDTQGKISGIIDWGDICAGDCATDLAAIWMLFEESETRRAAIQACDHVDAATWARTKGWALLFGVTLMDAGLVNEPRIAVVGERTLQRLNTDYS